MTEDQKQEARIQQEMVQVYSNTYCLKHHSPRCLIAHVPNQNQQHLVSVGVLPGFSDLLVIHRPFAARASVHIYFEVKTLKGIQSDKQKEFQARVEALGYEYYIVRSVDEFMSAIDAINSSLSKC